MSQQYNNTNSGVMFEPHVDQEFIGQGNINIEGQDNRIAVVREKLSRDGSPTLVIYQRMGVLFNNDSDNEQAPAYSGPLDQHPNLRVAAWRGDKEGRKYLSMKVSEKTQPANDYSPPASAQIQEDDDIPF